MRWSSNWNTFYTFGWRFTGFGQLTTYVHSSSLKLFGQPETMVIRGWLRVFDGISGTARFRFDERQ